MRCRTYGLTSWKRALAAAVILFCGGLLSACAGDGGYYESYDSYDPRYPRPAYREVGPWDLPQSSAHPGPPTWYGCPQGSRACYPD